MGTSPTGLLAIQCAQPTVDTPSQPAGPPALIGVSSDGYCVEPLALLQVPDHEEAKAAKLPHPEQGIALDSQDKPAKRHILVAYLCVPAHPTCIRSLSFGVMEGPQPALSRFRLFTTFHPTVHQPCCHHFPFWRLDLAQRCLSCLALLPPFRTFLTPLHPFVSVWRIVNAWRADRH